MHEDHIALSAAEQPPLFHSTDASSWFEEVSEPTAGDEALAFLTDVDADGVHHLTGIKPDIGPVEFLNCRLPRDAEKVRGWVNKYDGVLNQHWTTNEVREGCSAVKPSKDDVTAIRLAHVDIDVEGANTDEALAKLRREITAKLPAAMQPSQFISSGGGYQLTFALDKKLSAAEAQEKIEALNNGLIAHFGGDRGTWNIDRLARLPGTQNIPDSGKRDKKGRGQRKATVYSKAEIAYSLAELCHHIPPVPIEESGDRSERVNALITDLRFSGHETAVGFKDLSPELAAKLDAAMGASPKLRRAFAGDLSETAAAGGTGKRATVALLLAHHGDFDIEEFATLIWLWAVMVEGVDYAEQKLTPRDIARLYARKVEPEMQKRAEKAVELSTRAERMHEEVDGTAEALETKASPDASKQIRRLPLTSFSEAAASALELSNQPLVQGLLDQGTLSVIYGPSNAGKTFVVMDLAFHIATGMPWGGMPTTKGTVLYVAAEGGPGARKRARALEKRFGKEGQPVDLEYVLSSVNLLDPKADLEPLIATMGDLADAGRPVIFLVIDTFSRAFGGGDENGSTDMGTMVTHFDRIRQKTSSHVCIVHHSGKQLAKGSRGHSLLRSATDTEIELIPDQIAVTKQRDLEGKYVANFRLVQVELGKTDAGAPVTSAVIELMHRGSGEPGVATPAEEGVLQAITAVAQSLDPGEFDFRQADIMGVLEAQEKPMSKDGLRKHLANLMAKRLLESPKKGFFRLPNPDLPHSGFFERLENEEANSTIVDDIGTTIGAGVFD